MLKHKKDIKGVKIGDVEHILSQFADETTIILDGSEQSLAAAIKTLDSFAKLSNHKVNISKTRAISSLQCYSVLSTIAQVLRKMSLKILVS